MSRDIIIEGYGGFLLDEFTNKYTLTQYNCSLPLILTCFLGQGPDGELPGLHVPEPRLVQGQGGSRRGLWDRDPLHVRCSGRGKEGHWGGPIRNCVSGDGHCKVHTVQMFNRNKDCGASVIHKLHLGLPTII